MADDQADIVVVEGRARTTGTANIRAGAIAQERPNDLGDALAPLTSALVSINSRGETTFSVRGRTEREAAVLLGGLPLADPWDGRADLSAVPARALTAITLRPEGNAALASGSVLELSVKRVDDPVGRNIGTVTVQGGAAVGQAGFAQADAAVSAPDGSTLVAIEGIRRDGWTVPDGAALPYSQTGTLRTNTDRDRGSIIATIERQVTGAAAFRAIALSSTASYGIAPESHLDPAVSDPRFWRIPDDRRAALLIGARYDVGSATVGGEAFTNRTGKTIRAYADERYRDITAREETTAALSGLRLTVATGTTLGFAAGAELVTHEAEIVEDDAEPSTYRRRSAAAFATAAAPLGPRWDLAGGLRIEGFETTEASNRAQAPDLSLVTGQLTARGQFATGWTVSASMARTGRLPTQRELYGEALGRFLVDQHLSPEKRWSFGTRIEYRRRTLSLSINPFLELGRDTIVTSIVATSDGVKRQRVNSGGDDVVGADVAILWQATDELSVRAAATVLDISTDDDVPLFEKPDRQAYLAGSYDPPSGLGGTVSARYRAGAFSLGEDGNPAPLGASAIWDGELRYRLPNSMTLFLRSENVFDVAELPQLGLPGPGRHVLCGIRLGI